MIKANFYPDNWTGSGTTDLVGTKSIISLNLTDKNVDPMAAYYMGKIDKNQTLMYRATFNYDSDAGIYKLEYNNQYRVNWGYTYCDDGSNYNPSYPQWWNYQGKWRSIGSYVYFLNSMKYYKATMASVNYLVSCYLYEFSGETTLGTGEHIRYATTQYSGSFTSTVNDFYEVFYSSGSWTVTINSVTYTLSKNNWNSSGWYFDVGNNKRIYVYQIIKGSGVNYNCNYYNNHNFYLNLTYSIEAPTRLSSADRGCVIFQQFSHYRAYTTSIEIGSNRVYTSIPSNDNGQSDLLTTGNESIFGTKPFNVSRVSIQYACTQSPTSHVNEYIINSNDDLIKNTGTDFVQVNYFCDVFGWVKYVLGIAPKWATGKKADGTAMAVNNNSDEYLPNTAVPLFNNSDSPTGDVIKTDTYRELESQLRPWQKYGYNIYDDDFDPDSPGTPTRPDPTPFPDGENVGDDIYLPNSLGIGGTLGFITQFALTAAQIGELGNLLWTSFLDPDYWKNYLFRFILDTGSFNMSDLLNYFISLRVYPFSMINIPSLTNYGQDMFIGAGIVPLHYTNDLYTINTLCEYLDAGSLQMPFVFGDFRDCTNMEIILYLPYCGTVQLEPAEVLGGKLTARYAIDFGSGACTAYVEIDTWDGKHYLLSALPGQIGSDVPMSAQVAGQVAARIGSDVINMAGTIGRGTANMASSAAELIAGIVTNNPQIAVGGAGKLIAAEATTVGGVAGQLAGMAQRPGIAAPMLSAGRGFSSHGSPRKCYVQIRSPQYKIPDNYKQTAGTPAAKQVSVSSCSGLCRFVNPVIAGVHGTEEEKNKIRQLLQTGIIV